MASKEENNKVNESSNTVRSKSIGHYVLGSITF